MKKGKIFAVLLVVLMLAGGLVLMSCANKNCPGDGKCFIKQSDPAGSIASWCFGLLDETGPETCFGIPEGQVNTKDLKCGC